MAVNFPSIAWIPVAVLLVVGLGFLFTEMAFFIDLGMISKTSTSIYKSSDGCFNIFYNNTLSSLRDIENVEYDKCKSDYGFLGWKQWTTENEELIFENALLKVINPSPQKIIIVPEGSNFNYELND